MKWFCFIFSFFALYLLSGCLKNKIAATGKEKTNTCYDSEFPSKNAPEELGMITRSVRKVYCVSSYTTYQFKREAKITGYHLFKGIYKNAAWGVITTNETVFGTATIIGAANSKIALLTCAHIVNSPDTLISYFEPIDDDPTRYIQSFSIKDKQENWVKELSLCGPFTILATDDQNDVAILGKNCESLTDTVIPFHYPSGQATDLAWGSFVYIFGYPMGNQVITKGIVSLATNRTMGDFTVDALLNKGYSGGIILAVRHGVPNFELVGMVKTVNSVQEEILRPVSGQPPATEWLPYRGDIYTGKIDNIQYGLNTVVPIETIRGFYKKNRPELIREGYNLDEFFNYKQP